MRTFRFAALVALLCVPCNARAAALRLGFEAGGSYGAMDLRSSGLPNQHIEPRLMPALGIFVERPVSLHWSIVPAVRYAQQGEKSTWHDGTLIGGNEISREHTLSGGLGVRYDAGDAFVSLSSELTYLLSGRLALRTDWNSGDLNWEGEYASTSDRWNSTVRAGIGVGRAWGGGTASLLLRYARGINDMTRIARAKVPPQEQNISWTLAPPPLYVSEWRAEALELVAGFRW